MLRTRGYAAKGKTLVCKGEFVRKARVSCLCMIGQKGMLECSFTEGTFTRLTYFEHCKQFALKSRLVETYPGYHSIWILDGARIHCDDKIVSYFRSLGIFMIFLPAYSPFYNPIEIVFGLSKGRMQHYYRENSNQDMKMFIAEVMSSYVNFNMTNLFRKCGYKNGGKFDPTCAAPEKLIDLTVRDISNE